MSTEDRRAPGAARISFDGLVEVGGTLGPSFEAQAVNVSEEGMQLRTAYLPELGQQVTCRFEAGPNESVIGSGEVVWCRGAEKGGEFGIRFTDIDADSVEALKHVCGLGALAVEAKPGAKVRLYIEGLASPMRAKIRDSHPTEITVGSDLGFLQVGKQLELEDAASGTKRPASIDHVEVAVDPISHVPQLVVTLRYADVPADPQVMEGRPDAPREDRSDDLAALDDASAHMRGVFARQAARIAPAVQRWANHAKLTIALLAKRRPGEDESVPRRTTAPAPSGGLHASGRRVVRGDASAPADGKFPAPRRSQHPDDLERSPAPMPRTITRKAAVAGGVMLIAVLGAVALKKSHHDGAPVGSAAAPVATETRTIATTPAASAPAPPSGQQAMAEAAPTLVAPPPAAAAQTEGPAAAGATSSTDEGADGTHPAGHKKQARVTPFGNGPVHHGNVLRLRMDGPIESIEGAQQPTGFAVKVPGRRSLEAAAPLAARDSRIASIKVNNESSGAMLTIVFKDGVPNYRVSAKGDALVIALAPVGPLEATVAKRDDRTAKSPNHTRARDDSPER